MKRNITLIDISSKRNVQGTDITSEKHNQPVATWPGQFSLSWGRGLMRTRVSSNVPNLQIRHHPRQPEVFLVIAFQSLWEREGELGDSGKTEKRTHWAPVTVKSKTMYICILRLWQVTHRTQPSPEDNLRNVSQYWLGRPSPPPPLTRHPMWHTRGHTHRTINLVNKYHLVENINSGGLDRDKLLPQQTFVNI